MKVIFLALLILGISCSKNKLEPLFSIPEEVPKLDPKVERIVFAISNNEKGLLNSQRFPIPKEIITAGVPTSIEYGGPELLSGYINILREKFKENLVLLDSGRFLNEASNKEDRISIVKLYKYLNYDGILFTEKEILPYLGNDPLFLQSELPFVNSNIIDLRSKMLLANETVSDSRIIKKEGLKIGLIGLTSYEGRKITDHNFFKGIYFEKPAVSFLEFKNKLKKDGADIIILIANFETKCESKMPPRILNSPRPSWAKIYCEDKEDELLKFVKRIPRGSLDLLILGNGQKQLRGYLFDTPVVSAPPSSGFLSLVELYYHREKDKLFWDRSLLYPHVKLCENFFSLTSDCHLDSTFANNKERINILKSGPLKLVPARFLGSQIVPDSKVKTLLPIIK